MTVAEDFIRRPPIADLIVKILQRNDGTSPCASVNVDPEYQISRRQRLAKFDSM